MQVKELGFSICVFAYNEESVINQTLIECAKALEQINIPSEIIMVDDCSTDCTNENAKDALSSIAIKNKIITHKENRGPTAAMLSAGKEAIYSRFVLIPGDLTYDALNIKKMLLYDLDKANDAQLTLGIRNKSRAKRTKIREISSRIAAQSLIWHNPKYGFLPNYGFIICPSWVVNLVPKGVKPYGQAIGLLGVCTIKKIKYKSILVDQIPGSEERTSSLSIRKILDIIITHVELLKNRQKIKSFVLL
jgi:glycosyltransferase involved in cell wall biosynthesis